MIPRAVPSGFAAAPLVLMLGCATTLQSPEGAHAGFVVHAEALGGISPHVERAVEPAVAGGVGVGVEFEKCCGVGLFGSSTGRGSKDDRVAAGGLELSIEPDPGGYLRLAGRLGRAATQPRTDGTTASGFLTGLSLGLRVWDRTEKLEVGRAAPTLDIVAAYDIWRLTQYTAAGAVGEENGSVVLVGLRFGAIYGLDLK